MPRPTTSWVNYITSCNTQSSAPEDGRNHRPEHVEVIGIINKPLLLHLVGCLYYLSKWAIFRLYHYCIHRAICNNDHITQRGESFILTETNISYIDPKHGCREAI